MNLEVLLFATYFIKDLCLGLAQKPKWFSATQDKCLFMVTSNWTILFSESPSLFLSFSKKSNFDECRSACCLHRTCNGYVFDGSDPSDNCKLLKCSSKDCKKALKKYDNIMPGEFGFITGLATTPSPSVSSTLPSHPQSTENIRKIGGSEISQVDLAKLVKEVLLQKKNISTEASLKFITNDKENSYKEENDAESSHAHPTSSITSMTHELHLNRSREKFNVIVYNGHNIKSHTNTVSLTVALVFGIFFLLTVIYLTGKRWLEVVKDRQRRGYTRIAYLLNGV